MTGRRRRWTFIVWVARNRPGTQWLRYPLPRRSDRAEDYRAALEAVEASIAEVREFEALWEEWLDYLEALESAPYRGGRK